MLMKDDPRRGSTHQTVMHMHPRWQMTRERQTHHARDAEPGQHCDGDLSYHVEVGRHRWEPVLLVDPYGTEPLLLALRPDSETSPGRSHPHVIWSTGEALCIPSDDGREPCRQCACFNFPAAELASMPRIGDVMRPSFRAFEWPLAQSELDFRSSGSCHSRCPGRQGHSGVALWSSSE